MSRTGLGGYLLVVLEERAGFRAAAVRVTHRPRYSGGELEADFPSERRRPVRDLRRHVTHRPRFSSEGKQGPVTHRPGLPEGGSRTLPCMTGEVTASIEVAPGELGSSLRVLRLCVPLAQEQMQLSLAKLGQLTPVQAWRTTAGTGLGLELFDGIKRWRAAQALSWPKLRVEVHALDAAGAKVRLLRCNATAGLSALEEAWVVRSLYREDKLDQPHIAQLVGHDKSWVCRKLTLAEGLSDELTASVQLGLVSATAAVELARLQRCNQDVVAQLVARRGLTTRQAARLVDSLLAAPQEQWPKLLEQPSPLAPSLPKGGAQRRTPGEQLVADAWGMKRLSARLQARLLERSLESLGAPACAVVSRELTELQGTLRSLGEVLDQRLAAPGASDAAA